MSKIKTNPQRKRMKAARKRAGHTEESMAEALGVSKGNIWYYETPEGKPSDAVVGDYARVLGDSERYFRTGRRK